MVLIEINRFLDLFLFYVIMYYFAHFKEKVYMHEHITKYIFEISKLMSEIVH